MLKDRINDQTVIMDYACGPGLVSFNFLDKAKRLGEPRHCAAIRTSCLTEICDMPVGVDVAQGMVDVFNQRVGPTLALHVRPQQMTGNAGKG